MKPELSERALRRAVADLSDLEPDDLQGVLDRLDDEERATITAMLAALETKPMANTIAELRTVPHRNLSPWLSALLGDEPGPVQLTPTALRALRTAAERHGWSPSAGPHQEPTWKDALFGGWRSK